MNNTVKKKYNINDIIEALGNANILSISNESNKTLYFSKVDHLGTKDEDALTFIDHRRNDFQNLAENCKANFILCAEEIVLNEFTKNKIIIRSHFPKLQFSILANKLFSPKKENTISKSAKIDIDAKLSSNVFIGENCVIGASSIGENTIIYDNVFIADNVSIGQNCIIYSGAVIGMEGFGYNRNEESLPIQFPHFGGVCLEDYVEIGANSTIDRATFGNTYINYGTKIDNLVHIGHNVNIGKFCYVAAGSTIAGSTVIGDACDIWTGVHIADGLKIGNNVEIGIGSVVIQNVDDNKKIFGNPARNLK